MAELSEHDLKQIKMSEQTRAFLDTEAGRYFRNWLDEKDRGGLTNLLAETTISPVEMAQAKGKVKAVREVQTFLQGLVDTGARILSKRSTEETPHAA